MPAKKKSPAAKPAAHSAAAPAARKRSATKPPATPGTAAELERLRSVVRKYLPKGYAEMTQKGMTVWAVPLSVYPDTYNGHPLWYVALSAHKSYNSLHLMGAYGSPVLAKRLVDGFKAAGKRLDMGKACVHFKAADDLALDVIGDVVAALPMDKYVAMAKAVWRK